jgi:Carboxypeptidase regulatory-like domain
MTYGISGFHGRDWGRRFSDFIVASGGIAALCVFLLLARCDASAQVTGQGSISGTVTDSSGAVIAGAPVAVTNVATGVAHDSITNSTGYFEVDNLNPGAYSISVDASGFEHLLRSGITLEADARVNVPLKLQPGQAVQTITVTADVALLNTESASLGQVLTTRQVEDLTVSGSSPTWLELIAPGVQATTSQAASTGDGGGLIWVGLTQDFGNFGHIGHNEFSLDGAPNESSGDEEGMNQAPDAVGEMKMDATGYDASIGHTLGVSVTSTTKAGTNQLHGAVRETYTDTRWSALNHFQALNYEYQQSLADCYNGAATSPACYALENKYGNAGTNANNGDAALGGPIYIPKMINGRNKLFFFGSGIIDNFAGVGPANATVPTVQEQGGNFNDYPTSTPPAGFISGTTGSDGVQGTCPSGTSYYGQYQIYNPYSVVLDSNGVPRRTPFCGNQIPAGLLVNSAMTQFYNKSMPVPNSVNFGGSNYAYSSITPQTFKDATTREDWKISPKNDLFVRYTWQRYTKTTNSPFTDNVGREAEGRWIQLASIGWNYIINNRTNLDITWGGTSFKNTCCGYPGYKAYTPSDMGLPSYTDNYAQTTAPAFEQLPVISFTPSGSSTSTYTAMGFYNSGEIPNTTRDSALNANLTLVMGRHTIRAGAEWRLQNFSQQISGNVSGTYDFDDTYTQENNGSDSTWAPSQYALSYAAFLMGINTTASVSELASESFQSPYYAVYGDDTWRVSPRLTIIPGLRFELEDGLVEKHNELVVGWNPSTALTPISGPANTAYAATLAAATPAELAVLPSSLTIEGGPLYAGVNGNPRNAYANSYRFMPRLGATYRVNSRIVIRAGYGLFYDTMNAVSPQFNEDGFSASTSASSSTTNGTNFTPGTSPLSNPFPANSSGVNFNSPVGSSAGALYYLGAAPTDIYDHAITPAREQRGSIGVQYQFGASTMLDVSFNIARTSHELLSKNNAFIPQSFFIGGQQPNTAAVSLLSQLVPNPFNISNFSSVASSDPAAYSIMSHSNYYTASTTALGNLVRAYPQMGPNWTEYEPLGSSDFQEFLFNLTHRWSHGFSLMGSFEINDQHDADYFANAYDPLPSWESSNYSTPTRLTVEEVWDLPFGRGNPWATSGWRSAAFGGFQIASSYEAQPGSLVNFNNLFYIGNPTASEIKIKHPIYVNDLSSGGSDYVQWLNPGTATASTVTVNGVTTCTYSGNGFVTNPSCQPATYNGVDVNERVFPTRIDGVRAMGMNNVNGNVSRTFHLAERLNFQTSFLVYNVFNHQGLAGPNATPTSSNFGRVTSDGFPQAGARWVSIQGRLRF